jgi:nucleoside-diphosphate-sugar epimerase
MRIFLAGATGVVGRRLAVLLRGAGHEVAGTTRSPDKVAMLLGLGIAPVVVDMFDAGALTEAVTTARPEIVIHQVTDLPSAPGTPGYPAAQQANRRLRIEGTRNLIQAANTARVRRVIAQSIAFAYAPGDGARVEADPLDLAAEGVRQLTVQGTVALERDVLTAPEIDGVVLRYGYLYGPDTWYDMPAQTALSACRRCRSGRAAGGEQRCGGLQYRRGRRRRIERQGGTRTGLRSGVQDGLNA